MLCVVLFTVAKVIISTVLILYCHKTANREYHKLIFKIKFYCFSEQNVDYH